MDAAATPRSVAGAGPAITTPRPCDVYPVFHRASSNPPSVAPALSEAAAKAIPRFRPTDASGVLRRWQRGFGSLVGLAQRRRSGEFVEPTYPDAASHAFACAGVNGWNARGGSTASAGSLRPIVVHALVPEESGEMSLWWLDDEEGRFELVGGCLSARVAGILGGQEVARRAIAAGAGAVTLSIDTRRCCGKYADRGYRFALIEAGAAWQNIDLFAAEHGIEVRSMGGFMDEGATELLCLPDGVLPALIVLVG